MRYDPLIYWMAHVGTGSWMTFKRTVRELAADGADVALESRQLHNRLSDLGLAQFFVEGSDRWCAIRPAIVASPHKPHEAFLLGVRTPDLTRRLRARAERFKGQVFELVIPGLFSIVRLHGTRLPELAADVGLSFVPDIGKRLTDQLVPISRLLPTAIRRAPPEGWKAQAFDLRERRWREGFLPNTVVQYTSRYEERMFLVHRGGETFVQLPKREAVFAAAALQKTRLARYDAQRRELSMPVAAPLPEPYARAACVAAMRPSAATGGALTYEDVPPHLAATLLVQLGQLPPRFHFCSPQSPGRVR